MYDIENCDKCQIKMVRSPCAVHEMGNYSKERPTLWLYNVEALTCPSCNDQSGVIPNANGLLDLVERKKKFKHFTFWRKRWITGAPKKKGVR